MARVLYLVFALVVSPWFLIKLFAKWIARLFQRARRHKNPLKAALAFVVFFLVEIGPFFYLFFRDYGRLVATHMRAF